MPTTGDTDTGDELARAQPCAAQAAQDQARSTPRGGRVWVRGRAARTSSSRSAEFSVGRCCLEEGILEHLRAPPPKSALRRRRIRGGRVSRASVLVPESGAGEARQRSLRTYER
jgi:hypothetical protein